MEKLLQDLSALVQQANGLVIEYRKKLSELNEYRSKLEEDRAAHEEQKAGLKDREEAVKFIENIQELHREAIKTKDLYNENLRALTESMEHHKKQVEIDRQKSRNDREEIAQMQRNFDRLKNNLDAEVTKRVNKVLVDIGVKNPDGSFVNQSSTKQDANS